ncbi:hypothetical protein DPMN_114706 [Dreissena polymorpha]|uniref:Uncharacterized protein n=1 Tax=Dreissena polymorpha TaxID=45954 RepID=A0A9D4QSR6_DREPO|nr:hypothetical protein DPMN_114706 [Dreissena polymorpha]
MNVEQALTSTFGKSPEYRAGANVEQAPTLTIPQKSRISSWDKCGASSDIDIWH